MNAPVRLVCPQCGVSADGDEARLDESLASCACCGMRLAHSSSDGSCLSSAGSSGDFALRSGSVADGRTASVVHSSIGRYQIRDRLGDEGGVPVHRAYDPKLDRDVAIKLLEGAPGHEAEEQFWREARLNAQLDHPNILALLDFDRDGDRRWIVYPFIAGSTLAEHHRDHPVDASSAARIVRELAAALEHAHRRGVCHGDVKLGDVRVDGIRRIRLTGFGRVRQVYRDPLRTQRDAATEITNAPTPQPAPGEGVDQGEPATAASDVRALAVVLHGLLAGDCAVDTTSRPLGRSVPRGLRRVCRRALGSDPGGGYRDVRQMAADLDAWTRRREARTRLLHPGRGTRLAIVACAVLAAIGIKRGIEAPLSRPVPADPAPTSPSLPGRMPKMVVRTVTEAPGSSSPLRAEKGKTLFHKSSCVASRGIAVENEVAFTSSREAEARGYVPCFLCFPPGK